MSLTSHFPGNCRLPIENQDWLVPFPLFFHPLLQWDWCHWSLPPRSHRHCLLQSFSSKQIPSKMGGVSSHCRARKSRVSDHRPFFTCTSMTRDFWSLSSFSRGFHPFGTWQSVSPWTVRRQHGAWNVGYAWLEIFLAISVAVFEFVHSHQLHLTVQCFLG